MRDESADVPSGGGEHWRERAASLRRQGRFSDAADACRRALELAPGDAQAWSELAHALRLDGKLDEAQAAARRAIELSPRLASAWFNLGAVHLARGEAAHGIEANRRAVELKPEFAEAWSNLGGALAAGGDPAGEIDAYRRALDVNPQLAPVWSNLGNALRATGRIEEAVAACRRAVEVDPDFAAGWSNLGNVLLERGEREAALGAAESALRLEPELAEAWNTLGGALLAALRYDEAIAAQQKALALQPGNAQFHFDLGVTFQHCGRMAEAIACFRRARSIKPDHIDANYDLGFALLRTGDLQPGWDSYEWRWRRRDYETVRYDFTPWDGDVSKPGRLLLWGEQGIGDQIIYGSLLLDLVDTPLRVTVELDPRLVPLYQRSFPRLTVRGGRKPPAENRADYDFQAPLGSLGRWLRRSFDRFPRHQGYLKPDPGRVAAYRSRLRERAREASLCVGISWTSANKDFGQDKSTGLPDWLEILRTPGCSFVNLQYGDTAAERAAAEKLAGVRIEHLADLDLYMDLDGLAALCAACDLVITVSNVTVHVAGAVGCPAWLVLPRFNGRLWYWFLDRTDSPWYPSVRIFDQLSGGWRETLDAMAGKLAPLAGRR